MTYRRWYPTATTLSDGRVLVVAGQRYGASATTVTQQAEVPEIHTPNGGAGTWQTLPSGQRKLPYYPWMFQLPDGRVFNAGPNYRTGFFNPTSTAINGTGPNSWTDGPLPRLKTVSGAYPGSGDYFNGYRTYGSAVMYQPGKILVLGGAGDQDGNGSLTVTATTELLDLTQAEPQWQAGAPMYYPRYHPNATLLADGTVLVTGGTTQDNSGDAPAVLPTELWTPPNPQTLTGGSWQLMAALDAPRLYHSTAVLLPDATVLTAGGGQGGGYADHPDYQIFTPPYLCQPGAVRPVISQVPPAVAYGQPFRVRSPDAAGVTRATWVRLSSVTHSFNMNQRFLELPVSYVAPPSGSQPGVLELTAPGSAAECPPGHYMLFLLSQQGVPSLASIMQVSANACAASLTLTPALTQSSSCQKTYRFTVGNPTNCAADYRWWVNGVAQGSRANQATLDFTLTPLQPTAQVRVEATRQCPGTTGPAGATVAAEFSQTAYFPACSDGGGAGARPGR